jgi:quercetin dioxygenase-like cupin family protein
MSRAWRMSVYDAALGPAPIRMGGRAYRFVYVLSGLARIRSEAGAETVEGGGGALTRGEAEIKGSGALWVYEADPDARPPLPRPGLSLVLSAPFALPDEPQLIRADRIEAPPGAVTPRHGHRGPGIRRLLYGRILAELGDHHQRIEAGQAWFETGQDPIVGTNVSGGHNAFVRMMVLPSDLAGGKTSFVPSSPEEEAKSRAVTQTIFAELRAD